MRCPMRQPGVLCCFQVSGSKTITHGGGFTQAAVQRRRAGASEH